MKKRHKNKILVATLVMVIAMSFFTFQSEQTIASPGCDFSDEPEFLPNPTPPGSGGTQIQDCEPGTY